MYRNKMLSNIMKPWPFASLSGERGFGLIEAMISVVLLAIGILAIASGEVQTLTMQAKNRKTLTAISEATNMMELVRRNVANINSYNMLNTADATSTDTSPIVQNDFGYWKNAITKGLPGVANNPMACGARMVYTACGWVAVTPSPIPTVGSGGGSQVVIQIVWPGMPNGIQIAATVS